MEQKKTAIFLMGPTASGKTSLAVNLSQVADVDLISVDSAMIYRGMNIGTGKPDVSILKKAPHALIDIIDPKESYSVARFCKDAYICMEQSIANGKSPVLVGGTMMYYQALQYGLSDLPVADPEIREGILLEAKQYGWDFLHKKLEKLDPIAAFRIHANDPQRGSNEHLK